MLCGQAAEDDEPSSSMEQIKAFLRERLDPADFSKLDEMIRALMSGGEKDAVERANEASRSASDEPPSFRGEPTAGGGMLRNEANPRLGEKVGVQDRAKVAADADYFSRFPNAVRIGTVGNPARRHVVAQDQRPDPYFKRFPDAARIKFAF
jgi:hypothetical protein